MINTKFMRILLFFDLPMETPEDKKEYSTFRKQLIKSGYLMLQYSVYCKCVNTQTKIEREENKLIKIIPNYGNIRVLFVTEHQFLNMKILKGEKSLNEKINDEPSHIII